MAKAKKRKTGKKSKKQAKVVDTKAKDKMHKKGKKQVVRKPKVVVKLEPDECTFTYRELEQVLEAEKDAVDCRMSVSEHVRSIWPEIPMDIKPKIEPVVKQEPEDPDPDPEFNNSDVRDVTVVKNEILNDSTSKVQSTAKSLECSKCYKRFKDIRGLNQHKYVHKEKTFKCDTCDKLFGTKGHLDSHKKIHFQKGKKYSCKICQKEYSGIYSLKAHIQRMHKGDKRQKCGFCDRKFADSRSLLTHIRFEHFTLLRQQDSSTGDLHPLFLGRPTYECYRCKYTGKPKEVEKHMQNCNGERKVPLRIIKCELCTSRFTRKNCLKTHMQTIHSIHLTTEAMKNIQVERPYQCTFCDKSFFRPYEQSVHIRTEHFGLIRQHDKGTGDLHELFRGIQTFECYRCKFSGHHVAVQRHMVFCKSEERKSFAPFKCEYCNYRYANKCSIIGHMRNNHSIEKIKQAVPGRTVKKEDLKALYQCFDCKAYISNWYSLRMHMKNHLRPCICQYCRKRFGQNGDKIKHQQEMHSDLIANTKNNKYQCHVCKQSMQKSEAIKHLANVHQINRFECDICHVKLPSLIRLIRHKAIHLRVQKHECKICHKEFPLRNSLRVHERLVHQEKSHKCTFCDTKFRTKLCLTTHIRTEHFGLLRQLDRGTGDLHEWFKGNRTYECYRCKISADNRPTVKKHMKICKGFFRPVKCELCDKRFKNHRNVQIHLHHFHSITQRQWKIEQKLRKGEQIFECIDCKTSFISRFGLVRHMEMHCIKRGFKCEYCFQKFPQNIDRMDHQRRVHSILLRNTHKHKYECHVCKVQMPIRMAINHLAEKHQIKTVFELNICRLKLEE